MRVSIEASNLITPRKTGVGYYTERLLGALFELDPTTTYDMVFLAFPGRAIPDLGVGTHPNVATRRIWWLPGKLYNAFLRLPVGLPIDALSGLKPDLFFFPNFVCWPLLWTKRSVVVVHDVSFLTTPDTMVARHQWYLKRAVPGSIARATRVVTISENSKRQIIEHYGTDPAKIDVVTPALDHTIYRPVAEEAVAATSRRYGITGPYLLFVGTLEPRKNIDGIIRAYLALPAATRDEYQLVLAGGRGWRDAEIYQLIATIPSEQVVLPGYVAEADMAALYTGATLYLYPSHYEGWGMQILEAMACGTPVITANNSSLPEAGGGAAVYVNSRDGRALTSAITDLLGHPAKRAAMTKRGFTHAQKFTWERSAQCLRDSFEAAASDAS